MPGANLLLYSVNPWIKYHIQVRFRNDSHYVWCSEQPDSRTADKNTLASLVPPSSNPVEIYADLASAVKRNERHHAKIVGVKATYTTLAASWVADGSLSSDDRDELVYLLEHAEISQWRPIMYVIPRSAVAAKMRTVHPSKRAGIGMEYIIDGLSGNEFDLLEIPWP